LFQIPSSVHDLLSSQDFHVPRCVTLTFDAVPLRI